MQLVIAYYHLRLLHKLKVQKVQCGISAQSVATNQIAKLIVFRQISQVFYSQPFLTSLPQSPIIKILSLYIKAEILTVSVNMYMLF